MDVIRASTVWTPANASPRPFILPSLFCSLYWRLLSEFLTFRNARVERAFAMLATFDYALLKKLLVASQHFARQGDPESYGLYRSAVVALLLKASVWNAPITLT